MYILPKFIWYKKNLEIKESISFSNCKNGGLTNVEINSGGSRTAATFKLRAVNCYHKELHLGCCSSPRSASKTPKSLMYNILKSKVSLRILMRGEYRHSIQAALQRCF